ncbi:MAG: hypothetical protein U0228_03545 [Myxococcaceae bacterium]
MGALVFRLVSGGAERTVATLAWPDALEVEALAFVRDNLLAERTGSERAAQQLLARGRVTAAERAGFLAEKAFFPPEVSDALASAMDLEDFVAEFAVALKAFRAAPPDAELHFGR